MSWFKLDDSFHDHPKIVSLTPEAGWLWIRCATWSARHLTDGVIPTKIARQMGKKRAADELISAELWTEHGQGYAFHDWLHYQPSAEEVKEKRRANAQRVARHREKSKESNGSSNEVVTHYKGVNGNALVIAPRPVPSRPDLIEQPSSTASAVDGAFTQFWALYPRKVGKAAARKAWTKAARDTDPSLILEGVKRYANDPNLPADRSFIPHPATWLNAGRWDDEPLPPPVGARQSVASMFGIEFDESIWGVSDDAQ